MPDPTIAEMFAEQERVGNYGKTTRHAIRGAITAIHDLARIVAAQADRIAMIEAVIGERAKQPAGHATAVREAFEAGWEARDAASDVLDAEAADDEQYNAAFAAAVAAYLAR